MGKCTVKAYFLGTQQVENSENVPHPSLISLHVKWHDRKIHCKFHHDARVVAAGLCLITIRP